MTIRNVCNAIATGLLTCGMAVLAQGRGQAQHATVLPEHGGPITLVGCFERQSDKEHHEFVLVSPTIGAITSVPEGTCAGRVGSDAVELEGIHEKSLDQSMFGHWVQIDGKLEKTEGANELRELRVSSMREVPVVAPRTAEVVRPEPSPAIEAPLPTPQAEAQVEQPVATTGVGPQLAKTASPLPLIGLIGMLSLAGGLALRLLNRQAA